MAIAVAFGLAFAVSSSLRGDVLPGIVGGALGALLVWIVIGRVQEHNAGRRRDER